MLEFFIYSEIELKFNFSSLESAKGKKKYYLVIETRHVSERTATENKMSKKGAVRGGEWRQSQRMRGAFWEEEFVSYEKK